MKNNFQFTESARARLNREIVKRDANNIVLFIESEGYIKRGDKLSISSKDSGMVYRIWCDEHAYPPMKNKTLIEHLVANQKKYRLEYTNHLINATGHRVRDFKGIGTAIHLPSITADGWQQVDSDNNPFKMSDGEF